MSDFQRKSFLPAGSVLPFLLVTVLFFMWGIPNNLNDVLIKQFMKSMEITRFRAGLVQSAFYLGYFIFAIPSALMMRRYNYKTGIIFGLLLYATGCLLFWPAANTGEYYFFLGALFVIASGLAFLETGANLYISTSGDHETSERRLNFSQAFNPLGSVTGVLLGTLFIFSGIEPDESKIAAMKLAGEYDAFLSAETMRVVKPYLGLALFAVIWAFLIFRVRFPETGKEETGKSGERKSILHLFSFSKFRMGILAQFLYVGAQVGTWSYFITYIQDYTGEPEKTAGFFLTGTLIAFGVGRFFSVWMMRFFRPNQLMGTYSLINTGLVAVAVLFPGWTGVITLFFSSFFMSLMYPTIFASSIRGLGQFTKIGGSLLVMAIIGGAVCTPVMGLIAQVTHSMAVAMVIPLVAYLYIAYFSFRALNPARNETFPNFSK